MIRQAKYDRVYAAIFLTLCVLNLILWWLNGSNAALVGAIVCGSCGLFLAWAARAARKAL